MPFYALADILIEKGAFKQLKCWNLPVQLSKILRYPFYVGLIVFKGKVYVGGHEPIISASDWLKVPKKYMRSHRGTQKHKKKHEERLVNEIIEKLIQYRPATSGQTFLDRLSQP